MRFAAILLVAVILVCLLPLGGVILSSAIADWAGCTLNEGAIHPCVIAGTDWGPLLGGAFVSGWLMILTLPLAAFAALALVLLVVFDAWRRYGSNR